MLRTSVIQSDFIHQEKILIWEFFGYPVLQLLVGFIRFVQKISPIDGPAKNVLPLRLYKTNAVGVKVIANPTHDDESQPLFFRRQLSDY